MKHLIAGVLLFLVGTLANPADTSFRESSKWIQLREIKVPDFKAYYDSSSIISVDEDTRGGIFLVSFPTPRQMEVNGKTVMVSSIAKSMIINCKHGIGSPIMDLYFNKTIPTVADNPVAGTKYQQTRANLIQFERKSLFYSILCAIQV